MTDGNNTNPPAIRQLSIFDDRPLPFLVAEKWSFALRTIDRNDVTYYCVLDWLIGLTNSKNADQLIYNYRHRGLFSKNATTFEGDDYLIDKGIYRLTQEMRVTKTRPAVAAIKEYLADAGAFTDEVRRNPDVAIHAGITGYKKQGHDEQWIANRLKGINERKTFTDKLSKCVVDLMPDTHYAQATDLVSVGLFRRKTGELKAQMHLSKSQKLRDFQTTQALHYIGLVESTVAYLLDQRQEVTWDETVEIIRQVASLFNVQAEQLGRMMGIDVATGLLLIKDGKQ